MSDGISRARQSYILALIKALERRLESGALDEALADKIERLLGEGRPDPAGEAEYTSWALTDAAPSAGQTLPAETSEKVK